MSNKAHKTLVLSSCLFLIPLIQACHWSSHTDIEEVFAQATDMQKNHQPTQAMALYFDILKETKDPYILSRTYYNLGSIYMWDRVFDKAIDAYTHSYQQDSLLCDTLHMIRILKNMGNIRLHTGDSIESQRLYARALHLAKQRNDSTALAEIYRQHGWNFHKKNNFDSAAYYTRLSMNYSQSPSKLYSTLAEIHRHRQDIDSARYYLNLGINAPDTEDRHACLFFSSQLEHYLSNDQTAYEQLLTYTLMADTLYAQQKTREIEKMAYKHEAELKVRQAEERHKLYIGIGILAFIIAASIFLLLLQNQRRKKREAQLKYESALQSLNEKIGLLKENLNIYDHERETLLQHTQEQIAYLRAFTLKQTAIGSRVVQLSEQDNKDKRNIRVLTEKEQNELKRTVADIYTDEISRLKECYPRLTEGDLLYHCLASAGFSTFAIALCFGNSDTGIVAQRKRRMKLRMEETEKQMS